jgi:hypothetical protein
LERRESGVLAGIVDATMRGMSPELELLRADGPEDLLGPSQYARRFNQLRGELTGIDGVVRLFAFPGGVGAVQTVYGSREGDMPPQIVDVSVGMGSNVGSGPTIRRALVGLGSEAGSSGMGSQEWMRARQWFARMDAARRAGDWTAFGRAYEELRSLLGGARDSIP